MHLIFPRHPCFVDTDDDLGYNGPAMGNKSGSVRSIMFLGTGSDVGKSIAATAFCRILKRRGFRVSPFKAQNMSNNSYVTLEGGEIGRAQVVQAEAAGLLPSVHMNPILLKPSGELGAQIILHGKVFGRMDAAAYHSLKPELRKAVLASYGKLADEYDIIVMEGAGSCCEMNLKHNDLVNYLFRPGQLPGGYDCLILPGAKNVMEDAVWMRRLGWTRAIRAFAADGGRVLGICGGYQLLGKRIRDPFGVESRTIEIRGAGLLPVETILEGEKVVRRVTGTCLLNRRKVSGYEIHMGRSEVSEGCGRPFLKIHEPGGKKSWDDGWTTEDGRVAGTYVHGLLDSPGFRGAFLNAVRAEKGLTTRRPARGRLARFHQYDRLADHFEKYCDVDGILEMI